MHGRGMTVDTNAIRPGNCGNDLLNRETFAILNEVLPLGLGDANPLSARVSDVRQDNFV